MARLLDSALYRPSDLAARPSGDRFAVLLPDTDRKGAEAIAERLISELAALALPHPSRDAVTLSIGVAAHEPFSPDHILESPEVLKALSAGALERAQTVGGNQLVSS